MINFQLVILLWSECVLYMFNDNNMSYIGQLYKFKRIIVEANLIWNNVAIIIDALHCL